MFLFLFNCAQQRPRSHCKTNFTPGRRLYCPASQFQGLLRWHGETGNNGSDSQKLENYVQIRITQRNTSSAGKTSTIQTWKRYVGQFAIDHPTLAYLDLSTDEATTAYALQLYTGTSSNCFRHCRPNKVTDPKDQKCKPIPPPNLP